jgi:hypothetical protein
MDTHAEVRGVVQRREAGGVPPKLVIALEKRLTALQAPVKNNQQTQATIRLRVYDCVNSET